MRRLRIGLLVLAVLIGIAVLGTAFFLRDRYVVPILSYHHVADHSALKSSPSLNTVSTKSFAWQMKFLAKHGYNVISFEDYVDGVKKGQAFARNTVVIHFDDGYEDNYTDAFPILKRYGFPAMVFLISDEIGKPGYLTWEQLKEMEAAGFKAGAHTRRHAYLPDLAAQAAWDEIAGSKRVIEQHLGHPVDFFVYPSGGFDEQAEGMARKAGFKAAGTTNRGSDRFNRDLFELNRIRIKDRENSLTLWAKVSGYYNVWRKPRCGEHCKDADY